VSESLYGEPLESATSVEVAPTCVTVKIWPATFSVPVREAVLVLAVADQVSVPSPVPLTGVQVSQLGAVLDGVQLQPGSALTLSVPLLAAEVSDELLGEIV